MHFKIAGFKIHLAALLALLFVVVLFAYVTLRASFLGVVALFLLVAAVFSDLLPGGETDREHKGKKTKAGGASGSSASGEWKKLALEICVTLVVAVAAWFALCFALQTSSPLNVVTSCSMLPNLERGDFIILQGGDVKAPQVVLSTPLSQASAKYFLSQCAAVTLGVGNNGSNGDVGDCVSGVEVNGVFFPSRNDNDIVVYDAGAHGLIIHRVLAKIVATDGTYYLTKGDNNRVVDQQPGTGIYPVPQDAVKGRVIGRIPFLGYFKLLLFFQFDFPPGCDSTLKYLG